LPNLDATDLFSSFNSTLINGKGRYPGGPDVPLAVMNVKQGMRSVSCIFSTCVVLLVGFDVSRNDSYRFRLVSISCDPSFTFSIDNHNMTVIEVEGTNVQPLVVDSLQIFAGMRGLSNVVACNN
jgi:iron transport multicopper oxidase